MNKTAFIPDYESRAADPLDSRHCDFDWATLAESMKESRAEMHERDWDALVKAIQTLLRWIIPTNLRGPSPEKFIARRCIALLWTINPDYFDGAPSISELARQLKVTRATLSTYAANASRKFDTRNRGQSHGWNYKPKRVVKKSSNASRRSTKARRKAKPIVPHTPDLFSNN